MTLKAKRDRLREYLRRIARFEVVNIRNTKFKRVGSECSMTGWLEREGCQYPTEEWVKVGKRELVRYMWVNICSAEKESLFWEKAKK